MISIVGAGPSGNYLAYLLSSGGFKVNVFEEHSVVGKPVNCAGIVSNEFSRFLKLFDNSNFIINEVKDVKLFVPSGKSVFLKLRKNFVLNRALFDKELYKLAKSSGANFHLKHRLVSLDVKTLKLIFSNKKSFKTEFLVGADGPFSIVAKSIGSYKRRFFYTLQSSVRIKNNNLVLFGLFKRGFWWFVPENRNSARIGVACENPIFIKKLFLKLIRSFGLKQTNIKAKGGVIPIFNPFVKKSTGKTFLLGDAATQVKATTGGGIIPGMKAAEALSKSFNNNVKVNYSRNLMSLNIELTTTLFVRWILDRMSSSDYDFLLRTVNNKSLRKVFYSVSRDSNLRLSLRLLYSNPRLLFFVKNIFLDFPILSDKNPDFSINNLINNLNS